MAAVAVALAAVAPAGAAAPKCRSLNVAAIPYPALESSYRTLTMLGAKTKLVSSGLRRYGVCGTTHYVFDLLSVARGVKLSYRQQVAQQDHSPIWIQRRNGKWVDEGVDGLCKLAPGALINLWKVGAVCG